MQKHDLSWFQARKGKWIKRYLKKEDGTVDFNMDEYTEVKADNQEAFAYFLDLQENHDFVFTDTAATIAAAQYDFDLPEGDNKKAAKPRMHISDETCSSCQA